MTKTLITSVLLGGLLAASAPELVHAGQRTRNPGGGSGGSSSGSSGSSGGSTGSVAVPRDGGSSPWGGGGGTASSRPSEPSSSSSSGRRTARVSGRSSGSSTGDSAVPGYSRPRNGAPVTGYAVPRGSVATLPPVISGPIYWGSDDWYFYPWGYGGLALGYFWDPWLWSGYYGGWGGYPYWGGGGGGGSYGAWDSADSTASGGTQDQTMPNPLDPNLPTGSVRLKVEPRDAEVFVDGYYAGRVDDFDGAKQKLKITRGVHVIELRAAGYETATFNVTIVPGESTTYKTELKRR